MLKFRSFHVKNLDDFTDRQDVKLRKVFWQDKRARLCRALLGKIQLRTAYRVRKNIRANRMLMIQVPTLISLILPVKIFTKT